MNNPLISLPFRRSEDPSSPSSENFSRENNFYIYGDFDKSIAKEILPTLIKASEEQIAIKNGVIRFFIDSNGGYTRYLYNLLAILERAKANGVSVETYVFGDVYSCGSLLACAGTKGKRFIGENATHLLHLGAGGMVVTSDEELKRHSDHIKNHFNNVRRLYKKYAKVKQLDKALMTDSYFLRGKDIITNGLADHFIHP